MRGRCGAVARSRQSGIAHGRAFRQYAVTRHSPRRQSPAAGRVQLPCLSGLVSLATPLRSPAQPGNRRGQSLAVCAGVAHDVGGPGRQYPPRPKGEPRSGRGVRRAAGGAREDEADRRPPLWFRLPRRIPQRGRAPHAMLTYARRPLRLRVGRFGHHLPTEAAMPRNADEQN